MHSWLEQPIANNLFVISSNVEALCATEKTANGVDRASIERFSICEIQSKHEHKIALNPAG